jgi:hypothetical protein
VSEDDLRTDYWVDTRSDPRFPLWVIFKQIGREPGRADGLPYTRQSGLDLATLLKRLEAFDSLPAVAQTVGVRTEELRAALWYLIWAVETSRPPDDWTAWNQRLDEAWRQGLLRPQEL